MANLLRTAPGEKMASIQQAIVMLGRERLMRWLYLLLYASEDQNGCADPLCQLATSQSKTMESLARSHSEARSQPDESLSDRAGLTGMLSLAPALLGLETKEMTRKLSLDYTIEEALMRREGPLGQMLQLVEKREQGDLAGMTKLLEELDLSPLALQASELETAIWVNELSTVNTAAQ